jgi:hypothetical protein
VPVLAGVSLLGFVGAVVTDEGPVVFVSNVFPVGAAGLAGVAGVVERGSVVVAVVASPLTSVWEVEAGVGDPGRGP